MSDPKRSKVLLLALAWAFLFAPDTGVSNIEGVVVVGLSVAFSVMMNLGQKGPRALNAIGRYSYFIYFFHFFMVYLSERLLYRATLFFPELGGEFMFGIYLVIAPLLVLLTSAILGYLSFTYIENPIMGVARRSSRHQ